MFEVWFERYLLEWKIDLELGEIEIRFLICVEVDFESESEMIKKKGVYFFRKWFGNYYYNCMLKGVKCKIIYFVLK